MSRATFKATPAFCEDLDEDRGTTLPETRVNAYANVGVKRYSKGSPEDDERVGSGKFSHGSIAGDSGYSSQAATIADSGSDYKSGRKDRRQALRVDTSAHERKERRASESRPESGRRRSASQAPASRSKHDSRGHPSPEHDPRTCQDCNYHDDHGRHETLSRRTSRDQPVKESRERAQSQSRPQLMRSSSQRSSASRQVFVDNERHSRPSGYQAPPSAWAAIPPSPQYPVPLPQYHPVPPQPLPTTPTYQPTMRRPTVTHTSMAHPSSYPTPTTPIYSHSPIRDNRIPPYSYGEYGYPIEIVSRGQRDEEARRVMPPPPRPGMGRYATTNTIHQYEPSASRPREASSRRPSELEPVSATSTRPPSRTLATYSGKPSRRDSTGAPLTRRATIYGYEQGHDLEDKIQDAQQYQESRDINPRLATTVDTVKRGRAPSNAGSHQSQSSRGSGHKSTASGNITVDAGGCRISINDASASRGFSFQRSEAGFRLKFDEEEKAPSRPLLPSSSGSLDSAGPLLRDRRRSQRMSREDLAMALERITRKSSSSKRSDNSRK